MSSVLLIHLLTIVAVVAEADQQAVRRQAKALETTKDFESWAREDLSRTSSDQAEWDLLQESQIVAPVDLSTSEQALHEASEIVVRREGRGNAAASMELALQNAKAKAQVQRESEEVGETVEQLRAVLTQQVDDAEEKALREAQEKVEVNEEKAVREAHEKVEEKAVESMRSKSEESLDESDEEKAENEAEEEVEDKAEESTWGRRRFEDKKSEDSVILGVDAAATEQQPQLTSKSAVKVNIAALKETLRPTTTATMELELQKVGSPAIHVRPRLAQQTGLVQQAEEDVEKAEESMRSEQRLHALEVNQVKLESEKGQLQKQLEKETAKHRHDFQRMKAKVDDERKIHAKNRHSMDELEANYEKLKQWKDHLPSLLKSATKDVENEAAIFWKNKAAVEAERIRLSEKLDNMQKQLKLENEQLRLDKQNVQAQIDQNNLKVSAMKLQDQQEKDSLNEQFKGIQQELDLSRKTMQEDLQGLKGQLNAAKAVNDQLLKNLNALTEAKVDLEARLAMGGANTNLNPTVDARKTAQQDTGFIMVPQNRMGAEKSLNQTADALKAAQQETDVLTSQKNAMNAKLATERANMDDQAADMKSKYIYKQRKLGESRKKKLNSMQSQRNDAVVALAALLVVAIAVPCFFWKEETISVSLSPLGLVAAAATAQKSTAPAPDSAQAQPQLRPVSAHGGFGSK